MSQVIHQELGPTWSKRPSELPYGAGEPVVITKHRQCQRHKVSSKTGYPGDGILGSSHVPRGVMDLPKKNLCRHVGQNSGLGALEPQTCGSSLFMDISRTEKKPSIHNFMGYPILTPYHRCYWSRIDLGVIFQYIWPIYSIIPISSYPMYTLW